MHNNPTSPMDNPPPSMVFVDIMLEMQAACREKRVAKYEVQADTPLGTYEQALHAAFLVRELNAEVFPILNSIICSVHMLQSKTERLYLKAIHEHNWPEARRWMCVSMPTYKHTEVMDTLPRACANALRCMFAYSVLFLRKRDWDEAHLRMHSFAIHKANIEMALECADLSDTGGPNDDTPLREWERRVQPYLAREPAPRPEGYYLILEFGLRLRDATPLHPILFRTALLATHPRSASTSRLGALPIHVLQAILRWARWSSNKLRGRSLFASI